MLEQDLYNALRESVVRLDAGGQARMQAFGLTMAHFDALRLLSPDAGRRMGDLGRRLLIDNSKMTRIADTLVGRGLAERRRDAVDRRAWQLFLTPAGAALRAEAVAAHRAYLQQQFALLDDNEKTQLAGLLARLNRHLKTETRHD